MSGNYKIHIPHCYVWMTANIHERADRINLFNQYVEGYIAKTHPDLQFVRIKGMTALCKKREDERGEVD